MIRFVILIIFSLHSFFSDCYCQPVYALKLVDSIIIKSKLPASTILDIFYVNKRIWVRSDSWSDEKISIEFSGNTGSNHLFETKDSMIATDMGELYEYNNGLLLTQYSGVNLNFFDTLSRELKQEHFHINKYRFIPYPNTSGWARASMAIKLPMVVFSRRSMSLDGRTNPRLLRSFRKFYSEEKLFTAYDISRHKPIKAFGNFPKAYKRDEVSVTNYDYFFTLDTANNKLLVSFQAHDVIDVYDLKTFRMIGSFGQRGKFIVDSLLKLPHNSTWHYANRSFFNLLEDSYGDVSVSESKIFRIYRKGLLRENVKGLEPLQQSKVCISPAVKAACLKKSFEKKMYIQQYLKSGELEYELEVPGVVNTFLGFDESDSKYLFWNNTFSRSNGQAVIYVYRR